MYGGERSLNQYAVRGADLGNAGDMQELAPACLLERAPQFIRAPQQRNIGRVLKIAEPDETGDAMRGAAVVAGREAFDSDHTLDAPSKRLQRRASHHTEADHRNIEMSHASP